MPDESKFHNMQSAWPSSKPPIPIVHTSAKPTITTNQFSHHSVFFPQPSPDAFNSIYRTYVYYCLYPERVTPADKPSMRLPTVTPDIPGYCDVETKSLHPQTPAKGKKLSPYLYASKRRSKGSFWRKTPPKKKKTPHPVRRRVACHGLKSCLQDEKGKLCNRGEWSPETTNFPLLCLADFHATTTTTMMMMDTLKSSSPLLLYFTPPWPRPKRVILSIPPHPFARLFCPSTLAAPTYTHTGFSIIALFRHQHRHLLLVHSLFLFNECHLTFPPAPPPKKKKLITYLLSFQFNSM